MKLSEALSGPQTSSVCTRPHVHCNILTVCSCSMLINLYRLILFFTFMSWRTLPSCGQMLHQLHKRQSENVLFSGVKGHTQVYMHIYIYNKPTVLFPVSAVCLLFQITIVLLDIKILSRPFDVSSLNVFYHSSVKVKKKLIKKFSSF